mgnify:CR=1 FL=1
MVKIIILTGNHVRHEFIKKYLSSNNKIHVLKTFCEKLPDIKNKNSMKPFEKNHLLQREISENDFFSNFNDNVRDKSNSIFLKYGFINDDKFYKQIISLSPDLIVTYGCSIIGEKLIDSFEDRILSVHLGLSPYYMGTGCNFWPLVNGEPEYIGATFLHLDKGIDTGDIIHQIRARVYSGDKPHQIGNRLIGDVAKELIKIICNWKKIKDSRFIPKTHFRRVYKKKDFSEKAVSLLYGKLEKSINEYLNNIEIRNKNAPIIENKYFTTK